MGAAIVASSATDAAAVCGADLSRSIIPQVQVDPTRHQNEDDHDNAEQDDERATRLPES